MKPFFSIILPVYNVAAYLEETLRCLRAQTFGDFEAFLIDDGSTDGSLEFCLQAAEEDARLHVLRTPRNGGAAAARNVALPEISGQYVTFLDSDDTFEPGLLAAYADAIEKDPAADIFKCGFFEEYIEDGLPSGTSWLRQPGRHLPRCRPARAVSGVRLPLEWLLSRGAPAGGWHPL